MKLVDILARELKVWPELGRRLCQGHKGHIYPIDGGDTYAVTELAEDWELADVTRDEWQAAVDALKAPKVVEWAGEGLPPVGSVCEYLDDGDWVEVQVVAHDERIGSMFAVFNSDKGYSGDRRVELFRSIRAPEQIAADERDIAINAMIETLGHPTAIVMRESILGALYDAGYRKFEIVES